MTNGVQYNKFNANLAKEFDANLKLGSLRARHCIAFRHCEERFRRSRNMATRQSPGDEIPQTVSHNRTQVLRTYLRVSVFQCAFHCEGIVYLPVGRLRALAQAQPFSSQ
jgi:hypothetical protein